MVEWEIRCLDLAAYLWSHERGIVWSGGDWLSNYVLRYHTRVCRGSKECQTCKSMYAKYISLGFLRFS